MTPAAYSKNGHRLPAFSAGNWTVGLALTCQLILTLVPPAGQNPTDARDAPSMSQESPGGSLLPPFGHLVPFWGPSSTGRPHAIMQISPLGWSYNL